MPAMILAVPLRDGTKPPWQILVELTNNDRDVQFAPLESFLPEAARNSRQILFWGPQEAMERVLERYGKKCKRDLNLKEWIL